MNERQLTTEQETAIIKAALAAVGQQLTIETYTYDAEVDAAYLFIKPKKGVESKPITDSIIIDVDAEGNITGIEVLDAVKTHCHTPILQAQQELAKAMQPRKFQDLSEEEKEVVRKDYAKQIKNKSKELTELITKATNHGLFTALGQGFISNGKYHSDTIDEARTHIRINGGEKIYY